MFQFLLLFLLLVFFFKISNNKKTIKNKNKNVGEMRKYLQLRNKIDIL